MYNSNQKYLVSFPNMVRSPYIVWFVKPKPGRFSLGGDQGVCLISIRQTLSWLKLFYYIDLLLVVDL